MIRNNIRSRLKFTGADRPNLSQLVIESFFGYYGAKNKDEARFYRLIRKKAVILTNFPTPPFFLQERERIVPQNKKKNLCGGPNRQGQQ